MKPSTSADATANCVFPEDVMFCIQKRLPVKSILRFKSVCKPWLNLFATSRFVKMQHAHFSDNPENQSVIIYSLSVPHNHTMSLLKIESGERKPVTLDHPYPQIFFRMDFVGSCNGLICIGSPPIGKAFILWNPAIKLFKFVRISAEIGLRIPMDVSLGFGYDDEGDDFKVVRIARFKIEDNQTEVRVEVYSSISDSWRMIDVDFQFNVVSTKNDAIVNGNPYWIAQSGIGKFLVCFDVKKMVLSILPLPHSGLNLQGGVDVPLVDWKGSLGAIVCNKNGQRRVESLDVWVLDDDSWSKKHTFGIIDLKVARFLHCSKSGKILGDCTNGKLFVLEPATRQFEEIVVDGAHKRSFVIDGYEESLAFLQGMQKVVVRNDEGFSGDDNGDSGAEAEMGDFDIASLLGVY